MPRPAYRLGQGNSRTASSGSFHAGSPIPSLPIMRRQPTYRYQTFPTEPPKTPLGQPPLLGDGDGSSHNSDGSDDDDDDGGGGGDDNGDETPLPVRQLLLLAFLSLSEQTALNSIAPYLPDMVASMPGIPREQGGLYVGILASSFALAQLSTNFLWGYASDIVGRKPVLLAGTFALMSCFCIFGFCRTYWQIILVHIAMGLLNGNAACVPTVLGEVTDRSNQSRAFTYLPVIYSLGSITGPAVGGVLVGKMGDTYPYLAPNILGASMLAVSVVVVAIWFEETLEDDADDVGVYKPAWVTKLASWFSRNDGSAKHAHLRRDSWSARWPRGGRSPTQPLLSAHSSDASDDDDDDEQDSEAAKSSSGHEMIASWRDILNSTTVLLLMTYLVFQLSNISFNSLYPIFASTPAPTGRDLDPSRIGISLSLAGAATIVFQAFIYQPLKYRAGNLGSYALSLLGLAVSMCLMPWVGYLDDEPPFGAGTPRAWLYAELGVILVLKSICAVSGLSSVMLLITNSAPSHASLGTLNGIAQTLSALGRSFGPFVSGGLFTLSINIRPKGEALAWSIFGGLAFMGWLASLFVRGDGLESDDWIGAEDHDGDDDVVEGVDERDGAAVA
ncbi:hypothetical protein N3K66_002796 [Trichothecium roseum]|uniref:Uncharacterized protein n=1 Tax=Trichothecium roseum TaxID=47278 RepID=A0ACC0VAM1_9HYPO|nr:hypothetical protein N3K66_002796 [Trichothecium roseum]